jgi:hypothetical protein
MIRKITLPVHDPVTVAPLRRQAVADIGKDCAVSFVTAVSPQATAPG